MAVHGDVCVQLRRLPGAQRGRGRLRVGLTPQTLSVRLFSGGQRYTTSGGPYRQAGGPYRRAGALQAPGGPTGGRGPYRQAGGPYRRAGGGPNGGRGGVARGLVQYRCSTINLPG
ncbi:unnamed protein product [Boreogadus saida]